MTPYGTFTVWPEGSVWHGYGGHQGWSVLGLSSKKEAMHAVEAHVTQLRRSEIQRQMAALQQELGELDKTDITTVPRDKLRLTSNSFVINSNEAVDIRRPDDLRTLAKFINHNVDRITGDAHDTESE